MKCDQVRQTIRDVDRADRRQGVLEAPLRAHLLGCPACAADWARTQRLDTALGAIRDATAGESPSEDLESRLLEAFRTARAGDAAATPSTSRWSGTWRPWLVQAAAVITAFAVGSAVAVYRHDSTSNTQRGPTSPAPSVAAPREAANATQRLEGLAVDTSGEVGEEFDAPVPVSDFVALPYGPPTLEDPVHLVRVAIPARTLLDLSLDMPAGIAAPGDDGGEVVPVDVLVDEFGNARAIRIAEPADDGADDLDGAPAAFD